LLAAFLARPVCGPVMFSHHPALRMASAASSRRQCPRDSWTCCQRPWLSRGREWPEASRISPLCARHLAVAALAARLGDLDHVRTVPSPGRRS